MIDQIIKASKLGGAVLNSYFGKSLDTIQKTSASNFLTKADLESEALILESLERDFPSYNLFSEEAGLKNKDSEFTFYIDPMDGTNNFVLGIPNFSISIGLVKNDEIIAGVVYLPIMDQIYSAEKGKGAFSDKINRLSVSKEQSFDHATIAYNTEYNTNIETHIHIITNLKRKNSKRILTNWSAAYDLCLLASGKLESVINRDCEIHDFSAGKLIAKEAGAYITDFKGESDEDLNRMFVISNNKTIHDNVLETLI